MKSFQRRLKKLEEKHSQVGGRYPIFFLNRTSQNEYLLDMEQHEKILFDTKSDVGKYVDTKEVALYVEFTDKKELPIFIDDIQSAEMERTEAYLTAKSYIDGVVKEPTKKELERRQEVVRKLKE